LKASQIALRYDESRKISSLTTFSASLATQELNEIVSKDD
jgi:hypothetical protein